MNRLRINRVIAALFLFSAMCLADERPGGRVTVEVWHTFTVNSIDEQIFTRAVEDFEAANPDIDVEPVRIPYLQNLAQFINSSQGGEAPDLARLSDTELGKVGHISVEGCRYSRICDRTSRRYNSRHSNRGRCSRCATAHRCTRSPRVRAISR